MKRFIAVLSIITMVLLLFSSCGSKAIPEDTMQYTTLPSTTEPEQTVPESSTQQDGFVPVNKDGVIELKGAGGRCFHPCYDKSYYERYILVFKNVDTTIPKIKKEATIGIYTNNYESILLLPVDVSSPKYTVNMNFYRLNKELVETRPSIFWSYGSQYTTMPDFSGRYAPISECNGIDLETFINKNSEYFYHMRDISSHDGYKLLTAQKNQQFEFGGYVGTKWESFIAKADIEYYKIDAYSDDNENKEIPVEKTKNGYFTVDFSNLKPGFYYILEYDCFVELV